MSQLRFAKNFLHHNAVCIIKLFHGLRYNLEAIEVKCAFNHYHGHQTTESVQLSDILNIYFFIIACITSMLLNELILAGHCASCYAVSADS